MLHVDDGQLHAYLDGELAALDAAEAREIERHLASCTECQARLGEERQLRERAHAFLGGSGPAELTEPSFQTLAARSSTAGAAPRQRWARARAPQALAWAASILLALGLGWFGRELLRQPAPTRVAAESAQTADRPAAAGADARVASRQESQPPADTAPSAATAPAEPAPPPLATRHADPPAAAPPAPAASAPPAADVATTVVEPMQAPAPAGEAVAYGRVTNQAGFGIPNVSVQIPALNRVTLTRADGSYSLLIPAGRLAASEELAITATRVGMRSDTQRLVLQPGQEVAADFELRPATLALEEIVVTGQTREAEPSRAVAAAATPSAAAEGEVQWEPIGHAEAERRLGGQLRLVPGLAVVSVTASLEDGQPVIRTVQQLDGGQWLELLQRRQQPAREGAFTARARTEAAAAAAAPSMADLAPVDGVATVEIRRDGHRITVRAPVSLDSLRALVSQLR